MAPEGQSGEQEYTPRQKQTYNEHDSKRAFTPSAAEMVL